MIYLFFSFFSFSNHLVCLNEECRERIRIMNNEGGKLETIDRRIEGKRDFRDEVFFRYTNRWMKSYIYCWIRC